MGTLRDLYEQGWRQVEAGNLDGLLSFYHEDAEVAQPGVTVQGHDQIRAVFAPWFAAFSDMRVEFVDVVEGTDSIAGEVRMTMTHTGPLQMPDGEIPVTGKRITLDTCDVVHVRAGKVTTFHTYVDMLGFLMQLGAIPAPAQAQAPA